jgi:hypothetical protein
MNNELDELARARGRKFLLGTFMHPIRPDTCPIFGSRLPRPVLSVLSFQPILTMSNPRAAQHRTRFPSKSRAKSQPRSRAKSLFLSTRVTPTNPTQPKMIHPAISSSDLQQPPARPTSSFGATAHSPERSRSPPATPLPVFPHLQTSALPAPTSRPHPAMIILSH